MRDREEIYALLSKSLTSQLNDDELKLLNDWILESKKHKIEFDDIIDLWEKSQALEFPQKLNTSRALNVVREKAGIARFRAFRLGLLQQVAAILVISVLLTGLSTYFLFKQQSDATYFEEVSAAYGTRSSVSLPDGSTVCLNSGSSLRFSNQLARQNERRVELKGEGYFKVAKDAKHQFIVEVDKLEVKALGTEFNVSAYQPESKIEIALVEGKISIGAVRSKSSESLMILDPDQIARYNAVENKLYKETKIKLDKYIGWIDGKMIFIDDPIQDVMKRMENWYNVDIRLEDEQLISYRFTGTFINEPLEEILNVFSLTSPLRYEVKPATNNAHGEYTKRTIILKSK